MIVGGLKPLPEIAAAVRNYKRVYIMGCGSCVTVCLSGGEREARQLALELYRSDLFGNKRPVLETGGVIRQCELDLVQHIAPLPSGIDAILSLACGCGVQTVSDAFEPLPVIPALNTTFYGASNEAGVWREVCLGCGDCLLSETGGICPIARCAKSLLNGPCGGSRGGRCEIHTDAPCAWALIYYRLKKQNQLDLLYKVRSPRDWQPAGSAGPRTWRRTGIAPGNKNER